jgi:enoyl-[acyl-carrier protein] reductase II
LKAQEGDTVLTGVTVGDAVRSLKNALSEKVLKIEKDNDPKKASELIQSICRGALRKAAVEGDVEIDGSVVVGQIVGLLNKTQSVREIMEELIREYSDLLNRAKQYVN